MGRWNIINRCNEDVMQKLRCQLDDSQKTAVEVGHFLAEARSILLAYIRKNTNLRYTNYNDMILNAAKSSEVLTEKLRRLVLEITYDAPTYEAYKSDLVLIHGIEISYEQEILGISMPVLIPHRKSKFTDYLYKPLYTAFQHWCIKQAELGRQVPDYRECTVCFIHLYDESLPVGRVRDHDNIEEKHVLDAIGNFFLESDNGMDVDTYHMTRMGEKDRTIIYIMDTQQFPVWITENSI